MYVQGENQHEVLPVTCSRVITPVTAWPAPRAAEAHRVVDSTVTQSQTQKVKSTIPESKIPKTQTALCPASGILAHEQSILGLVH